MALVLRSEHRAALISDALSIPGSSDVRITSLQGLQAFVVMAHHNPNTGRIVQDLSIVLPAGEGYPAQAVRHALRLTPNVECLVLELPAESPATLLNGLHFAALRVFSTNLPHRALLSFLAIHYALRALILGACGRSVTCPLTGLAFRYMTGLQCPSRCFAGLIRGPLIAATINLSRLSSMSSLAVQSISSSRLYALTVDHFSNDYDILSQVVSAAPNLRKLKLNEKPRPMRRRGHLRRAWNDLRTWHNTLLRLTQLEELMVRTLVNIATRNRTEGRTVAAWANGMGRNAIAHPNLYHVGIIQKSNDEEGAQRVSHWFKRGAGEWTLAASSAIGPTDSFVL